MSTKIEIHRAQSNSVSGLSAKHLAGPAGDLERCRHRGRMEQGEAEVSLQVVCFGVMRVKADIYLCT